MEMQVNNSLPGWTVVSQTIPLDPKLDQDMLDFKIRVYRLDPKYDGKISINFHYPPTNDTLRALILGDYRPTFEMMTQSSLITQQTPYYAPNFTTTGWKKLYYMGVLPGPGIPLSKSVNFAFIVNLTSCVSWESVSWSSIGCIVGPNTVDHRVHCQCNHLSIFGAIFPVLPNKIDPFTDVKLFLMVWDNPLVISIMILIFVLYLIFFIIAYRKDKTDCFRGAITVLEDNFLDDKYPYLLSVHTSSRFFAGTSANVGVQIIGESANSRSHIFKSKYYKVLSRHSEDWFLMLCPRPLGIIQFLHIWHDNSDVGPNWYCEKVHVFDIKNSLECLIILDQWIEMSVGNYPEALVVPASSGDVLKIRRVFSDNISKSMKNDQKSITGILTQHPRCAVKRIYRANTSTGHLQLRKV